MKPIAFFTSVFCKDLAPTRKQLGVQARVIEHLKCHGSITAVEIQNMGTTAAHKTATRVRRLGFITRTAMEPNANGRGQHARYFYEPLLDGCECGRNGWVS